MQLEEGSDFAKWPEIGGNRSRTELFIWSQIALERPPGIRGPMQEFYIMIPALVPSIANAISMPVCLCVNGETAN